MKPSLKIMMTVFNLTLNLNLQPQIIGFSPEVDTLFTAGGCTPTQIIASYIKNNDNIDTIKISPGSNTRFWSGNYCYYDCAYFLIHDSLNRYRPELWMEPFQEDFHHPILIPFDSSTGFDSRNYLFKLKLFNDNIIVDSLSQLCHARIGIGVTDKRPTIIADNFYLSNYPNPFNQATTVKYHIAQKSRVKILAYDINGRLVDSLIDNLLIPGSYTHQWQTDRLRSGQYFILLKSEYNSVARKCLLLK